MKKLPFTLVGLSLLVGLGLFCPPTRAWADPACDQQAVSPLNGSGIQGHALLCIHSGDVRGELQAKYLRAGNAYTVWFIYLDDPSQCVDGGPGVCGATDFAGDKPLGVFGRFDSGVAPTSGKAHFSGRVRDLQPAHGSQIWLLIRRHGPVDTTDGAHRARQLLTPEDPAVGVPHLGNIIDGELGVDAAIVTFTLP